MPADTSIDVRTITDDEVPAWSSALATGFLNPSGEMDAEARRPTLYPDRTWGAVDDGRMVGTLRSFPTEMTLPGTNTVTVSAITAVTVSVTHRRRGLASRIVQSELRAAKDRGEQAAALISAEWPIYGRFGFGSGTEVQRWTVRTGMAQIARPVPERGRFVTPEEGRALAPAVYDRYRKHSPGELARDDRYWDVVFGLVRYPSQDPAPRAFCLVVEDETGEVEGLTRFTVADRWTENRPDSTITIETFVAATTQAQSQLWQLLIALDWADTVVWNQAPVDGVLPWLLVDYRHAVQHDRTDFLWWRPLDLPAVLGTRSYPSPGRVVLEVVDPVGLCGGRWAVEGGPQGGSCTPTDESADLTLSLGALSAVGLGGFRLQALADAGLVDEHSGRGVVKADDLFRCRRVAYCSTGF
jgi:predicted acetyltransferase